jgi:deoxyribodipyrimidine photolyase-related protein
MVPAGEHRVQAGVETAVAAAGLPLEQAPDRPFLRDLADFEGWAGGRRQPRLEGFYRFQRRRTGVLMQG